MTKSTIVTLLSYLLLLLSSIGFVATMELAYVVIMTTSMIGVVAGAIIHDDETRQDETNREFANRLNNINNK